MLTGAHCTVILVWVASVQINVTVYVLPKVKVIFFAIFVCPFHSILYVKGSIRIRQKGFVGWGRKVIIHSGVEKSQMDIDVEETAVVQSEWERRTVIYSWGEEQAMM